jgi:anti-sigma B factor antagonist
MHGAYGVTISADGPDVVLEIEGDIDAPRAPQLLDLILLASVVEEHHRVTLDLSKVAFVDSTGLAALVEARNRLTHEGIALTLRNPSTAVVRLVAGCGLAAFFGIEESLPDGGHAAEAS